MLLQEKPTATLQQRALQIGAGILVLLYLVNLLTPLRLHLDMLRYFAIKDCIELGCPPDSEAAKDYLPFGYTALLLLLSKLHILSSASLVIINIAYLTGTLLLAKKMLETGKWFFLFCILIMLNWTTIKFVLHPLSELQYMFFSMAALYYYHRFTQTEKFASLLIAVFFTILAIATRTVGVALAGAIVLGLIWHYRKQLGTFLNRNKLLVGVIIVIVLLVLVFSKQLGLNHYTGVMTKQYDEGMTLKDIIVGHFIEWGEISVNTSIARLYSMMPKSSADAIFLGFGILFAGIFIYALCSKKVVMPVIVRIYLVLYTILMFNWPFYDPRFWVPVTPLIIFVMMNLPFLKNRLVKPVAMIYLFVYAVLGLGSIGYMIYTSYNKEVFSRTQAAGAYRNEYETYFFGSPQSDTATRVDPFILSVIKRYDK